MKKSYFTFVAPATAQNNRMAHE